MDRARTTKKTRRFNFPALVKTIEERLQTYNWAIDETNVYSYTNRKKRLDDSFTTIAGREGLKNMSARFSDLKRIEVQKSIAASEKLGNGFEGSESQKMHLEILENCRNASNKSILEMAMTNDIGDLVK